MNELFFTLGRVEKIKLLKRSNLDDRERKVLSKCYLHGFNKKEISIQIGMDYSALNKYFTRILKKLHMWIRLTNYVHLSM